MSRKGDGEEQNKNCNFYPCGYDKKVVPISTKNILEGKTMNSTENKEDNRRIAIIATGGTIDKIYFDAKSEYEVGPPNAIDVLEKFNLQIPYSITSLMRKDSLDLTDADREKIATAVAAEKNSRIVITHGTDTMPETARHIINTGAAVGKTVVLTGSLLPAMFTSSDAIFNLGCALGTVQTAGNGVYIVMNGKVFPGDKVRKNREAGRFEEL